MRITFTWGRICVCDKCKEKDICQRLDEQWICKNCTELRSFIVGDPKVSQDARDLIERGKKQAME